MGKNTKNIKVPKAGIGGIIAVDDKGGERKIPYELPSYDEQPEAIYANHVIVSHTQSEFNLFFSRINPIVTNNQIPKGKTAKLDIVARIILPPKIMPDLIKAFESNLKKFEEKNK